MKRVYCMSALLLLASCVGCSAGGSLALFGIGARLNFNLPKGMSFEELNSASDFDPDNLVPKN